MDWAAKFQSYTNKITLQKWNFTRIYFTENYSSQYKKKKKNKGTCKQRKKCLLSFIKAYFLWAFIQKPIQESSSGHTASNSCCCSRYLCETKETAFNIVSRWKGCWPTIFLAPSLQLSVTGRWQGDPQSVEGWELYHTQGQTQRTLLAGASGGTSVLPPLWDNLCPL